MKRKERNKLIKTIKMFYGDLIKDVNNLSDEELTNLVLCISY